MFWFIKRGNSTCVSSIDFKSVIRAWGEQNNIQNKADVVYVVILKFVSWLGTSYPVVLSLTGVNWIFNNNNNQDN